MEQKYCPMCADELVWSEEESVNACSEGHYANYNSPLPVVVAVVAKPQMMSSERYKKKKGALEVNYTAKNVQVGIKYLLIKRGIDPEKGKWAFPAGYVNSRESPEQAVLRELKEETGLEGVVKNLLKVENPLPGKLNQILMYYKVEAKGLKDIKAGDDAESIKFMNLPWNYVKNKTKKVPIEGKKDHYHLIDIEDSYKENFKDFAFDSHIGLIKDELIKHRKNTTRRVEPVAMTNWDDPLPYTEETGEISY